MSEAQLDSQIPEPTRSLVHAARMALVALRHPHLVGPQESEALQKALREALDGTESQHAGGTDD